MMHLLRVFLPLLICVSSVSAHESCCKHKLGQQQAKVSEFIVDESDVAPVVFEGVPRWVPDPEDVLPDGWDEEDDGVWEQNLILNPQFTWKPRMIPNPKYVPPPTYWDKLWVEIQATTPWVTMGVLITGILSTISLPMDALTLHLSGGGVIGALKSAVLGLATPLCSCGALPVAAGLISRGTVSLASAVVFLTASQSAGLDSAAITWGLLGPTAVLCRLGGAIVLAVAAGLACAGKSDGPGSNPTEQCCKPDVKTKGSCAQRLFSILTETATEVIPTVFLGLAASTAALHYFPNLIRFEETDQFSLKTRFAVLVSAVPLQMCEHTTVTLVAAIKKAGGSPGLAFAFLLSAPATNAPSLMLLLRHGGPTVVLRTVIALCGAALILSCVVDAAGVDLLADRDIGGMAALPGAYVAVSPWLAGGLFLAGVFKRVQRRSSSTSSSCCTTTEKGKQKKN